MLCEISLLTQDNRHDVRVETCDQRRIYRD